MFQRNFDLILAFCLCLLSAYVAAHTYSRLNRSAESDEVLEGIPFGEQRYYVLQGHECRGTLEVSLIDESSLRRLHLISRLKVSHQRQIRDLSFEVLAFFNPLDQMVTGDIEFKFGDVYLLAQAKNVNPIAVSLRSRVGDSHFEREFTLPGPITLEPNDKGDLQSLRYHYLSQLGGSRLAEMQPQIRDRLRLDVVPAEQSEFQCEKESQEPLEVDELVAEFQGVISLLNRFQPTIRNF